LNKFDRGPLDLETYFNDINGEKQAFLDLANMETIELNVGNIKLIK